MSNFVESQPQQTFSNKFPKKVRKITCFADFFPNFHVFLQFLDVYKRQGIDGSENSQQSVMSLFNGSKHSLIFVERMLYHGVNIFENDYRGTHIDCVYRLIVCLGDIGKSLLFYNFHSVVFEPCFMARIVHHISIVLGQQLRNDFYQYGLAQICLLYTSRCV